MTNLVLFKVIEYSFRNFALETYDTTNKTKKNAANVCHYTAVTNYHCKDSVLVFQTLANFRNKRSLLGDDEIKMLKILTKKKAGESLRLKCVNVQLQSENGKVSVEILKIWIKYSGIQSVNIHFTRSDTEF